MIAPIVRVPYELDWCLDSLDYAKRWMAAHAGRYESRGQSNGSRIYDQLRDGKLAEFCVQSLVGGPPPDLAIRKKEEQGHDVDLPNVHTNVKAFSKYAGVLSLVFQRTDTKLFDADPDWVWRFVEVSDVGSVYPPIKTCYFINRFGAMAKKELQSNKVALYLDELEKAYREQEANEDAKSPSLPWW